MDNVQEGAEAPRIRLVEEPGQHRFEVLVVGSGPAAPQPDTPGSGILVRAGADTLMIDCGPGTMSRLRRTLDPRTLGAVIVTHFHADHYLDLIALRYLYPWTGEVTHPLPVYLPPGGTERLSMLAAVISERPSFFADAFDAREFDPNGELCVGRFTVRFVQSRHYVPAWGLVVEHGLGGKMVYSGDTGPNPGLVEAARGADLLIAEATLARPEDDVAERGHLALGEAMDHALQAGVRRLLVTHAPVERRAEVVARDGESGLRMYAGRPGLRVAVSTRVRPSARRGSGPGGVAKAPCEDAMVGATTMGGAETTAGSETTVAGRPAALAAER